MPVPDVLTAGFWEAARNGQLAIQRCESCGYYNHPPLPLCDRCSSGDLGFEPVSGRGTVYSYTTNYQRNVDGFEDAVPYVNLIVELEEQAQLFLVSDLPADEAEWVAIGAPVEVTFEQLGEEIALPLFRPARASS